MAACTTWQAPVSTLTDALARTFRREIATVADDLCQAAYAFARRPGSKGRLSSLFWHAREFAAAVDGWRLFNIGLRDLDAHVAPEDAAIFECALMYAETPGLRSGRRLAEAARLAGD